MEGKVTVKALQAVAGKSEKKNMRKAQKRAKGEGVEGGVEGS